ncbi:MAG TPA: hypothetical protein VEK32_22290 [Thermodesulfobacteriota bacterium]|nr:hypothetical protein [Thermodesulfobacteriota bacterium]
MKEESLEALLRAVLLGKKDEITNANFRCDLRRNDFVRNGNWFAVTDVQNL